MRHLAPQEIRTFFVTAVTHPRRRIFQVEKMAALLKDVMLDNRNKRRFLLHSFVIMPDHFHAILTPETGSPLEKSMQYIKGGFSYRVKTELDYQRPIWQPSFTEHRIKDLSDYDTHVSYIHENPVRAGLVLDAKEYPWSSIGMDLDPMPAHFQR